IPIPPGVAVTVDGSTVRVKGPKGELSQAFRPEVRVRVDDGQVVVERVAESRTHRALHGLTRALIANMVEGTVSGFRKTLELVGVGYRAEKKGNVLGLNRSEERRGGNGA